MGWGDEVMVTGQVREMQRTDPRKVRIVYERVRWHEAWDNNPRIAVPDERGDFQNLHPRTDWRRPYIENKTPEQWTWKAWGPPVGELYFSSSEAAFGKLNAGHVLLEPNIKAGASVNKDWGWQRWKDLAELLQRQGLPVAQMGAPGARALPGVRFIPTRNMRLAAAVVATSRAAVLPEGGLHHVAAAVGTPAVVLFGGFIAPSVTGYATQRNLFTGGHRHPLGCGMRILCSHCAQAIADITPQRAADELLDLLNERKAA